MIYDVSHKTVYRYSTPVVQSQHVVHMSPRAIEGQEVGGELLAESVKQALGKVDALVAELQRSLQAERVEEPA